MGRKRGGRQVRNKKKRRGMPKKRTGAKAKPEPCSRSTGVEGAFVLSPALQHHINTLLRVAASINKALTRWLDLFLISSFLWGFEEIRRRFIPYLN